MVINLMNIQKERKISMNTKGQLTNTTESQKGTKQDFLQKTWVVCALALVCTFLWGSASPCIKLGYALFQIPSSDTGVVCRDKVYIGGSAYCSYRECAQQENVSSD